LGVLASSSSDKERGEKVRHYLDHPEEGRARAQAGRERCLVAGYSNRDRLAAILEALERDGRVVAPSRQ
jgi:hypothetical protein